MVNNGVWLYSHAASHGVTHRGVISTMKVGKTPPLSAVNAVCGFLFLYPHTRR